MTYNISNNRVLNITSCEFFENWSYKQLVMISEVTDSQWKVTYPIVKLKDTNINYQTIKDMATCSFPKINGVIKTEACNVVRDYLVVEFDNRNLF